jgi:hypothetical protein
MIHAHARISTKKFWSSRLDHVEDEHSQACFLTRLSPQASTVALSDCQRERPFGSGSEKLEKIILQCLAATVGVVILAKLLLRSVFTRIFIGLSLCAKTLTAVRGSRRLSALLSLVNHSTDMAQKRALMFHRKRP